MSKMVFFKTIESGPKPGLLLQGYSRRTTAAEPRVSELVAEYLRIGYEVEVIEHQVEPNSCGICYEPLMDEKPGLIHYDVYVRPRSTKKEDGTPE